MNRAVVAATVIVTLMAAAPMPAALESAALSTLVGPALGTTWQVTLQGPLPGMTTAAAHREIEQVLAAIDEAASTWRADSDVSRFNRAAPGEWIPIGPDLAALVALAQRIHARSAGGFDITVGPLVHLWRRDPLPSAADVAAARGRVGMGFVEVQEAAVGRPAAITKTIAGVELDLDGIAPGYAVDRIGTRLAALGSGGHLVELGGEVRAWGTRPDGAAWRVALRSPGPRGAAARVVELAAGQALATSTLRPGGGAIDPRSGQPVPGPARAVTVIADSCAEADAWAVAALVLGLEADDRGLVVPPPARPDE